MSDIEFNCPYCNHSLVVDASGAGLTVNCPKCSKPIQIPAPRAEVATPAVPLKIQKRDTLALSGISLKPWQGIVITIGVFIVGSLLNCVSDGIGTIATVLTIVGTSIWVFTDSKRVGTKRTGKFTDIGPTGWLLCCLFFWILAFPLYWCLRPGFIRRFQASSQTPQQNTQPNAVRTGLPDYEQELRKLAKLMNDGIISAEDYEQKKKALLGL